MKDGAYGIGFAGFRHNHILGLYQEAQRHPGVHLYGAFEEDESAREQVSREHGVAFPYESYEALLCDRAVDIVALGDYYGVRGQRVIAALLHGKHVIVDKPLCTSLKELETIRRLAGEKQREVRLMLDLRFTEMARVAREKIAAGAIGRVNNVAFSGQHPLQYGSRPGWYFEKEKYGGTINDLAIHGIDLVTYLTGLKVEKTVAARCWNCFAKEEPDFPDSAQLMVTLSGGAGLIADVSYASPDSFGLKLPYYWRFEFWGTDGMMELGLNEPVIRLYRNGTTEAEQISVSGNVTTCLTDLVAYLSGTAAPVETTAEALDSTEKTLQIQQAAVCETAL